MPAGYRDSLEGLRAQLDTLRAELAPMEARLERAPWSAVCAAFGLAPAAQMPSTVGLDFDALARLHDAAESRRSALHSFFAALPDERAAYVTTPPGAPALRVHPGPPVALDAAMPFFYADLVREWMQDFVRTIASIAPGATVARLELDPPAWGVQFKQGDVPLTATLRVVFSTDQRREPVPVLRVRTTTALAAGPIELTPQGTIRDLLNTLGILRDIELGESEFDAMFVVKGDEASARAALTPAVRSALLAVAREDVPTVAVGQGRASVKWGYPPTRGAMGAACEAVGGMRAAPVVWPKGQG